ncbi:MAG: hypothetical protein DA408_02360 [Bacteroidetes bacterium]|nr:MAG: hypothetical protein C7N36_02910 [Bacteroidota bacterium]PTM14652.1 MAG: hypothetical protein DA408_02360 [Bacteroidota bacterium]
MKKILLFLLLCLGSLATQAQVTCSATAATGSGYSAFTNAGFGIEDPDCVHAAFGPHITQVYDAELDRNVFVFHSHIVADNDRCQVSDRVRMEIKGGPGTDAELQHNLGDTSYYRWKFRLDENFVGASSFCHIFQNKAVGGADSGFPILTLTLRTNILELRHNGGDTGTDLGVLAQADLALFRGKWVEGYLEQVHRETGELVLTLKDMQTGTTLLTYSNSSIDLWRTGATYNRPKWGMYRLKNDVLQDEDIRFADFCVSEVASALCPGEAVLQPDPTTTREQTGRSSIRLFPNPTQEQLHIALGENQTGTGQLFTLAGQPIGQAFAIPGQIHLDVAGYAKGIYVLTIKLKNGEPVSIRFILT